MGFPSINSKRIFQALSIASIFVVIMIGIMISSNRNHESLYWPGWYLLQVPVNVDETAVIKTLHSSGVEDIISPSTAVVRYMGIPELVSTTVDRIDQELLPGDPRRDPFLHNVDNLFRMGRSSLIYLPAIRSIASYRRIIKSSPILDNVILLDDTQKSYILTLVCFILTLCLFVVYRYDSSWWVATASLIGSLIVLAVAGRELPLQSFVILGVAVLGSEAVFFIVYRRSGTSMKRREKNNHQLFVPLKLIGSQVSTASPPVWMNLLKSTVTFGLIIPFAFFGFQSRNHEPVPAAHAPIGSYDSLTTLHTLAESKNVQFLPNVSDLIASIAFQENLLNGAQFGLPQPGAVLKLRQYSLFGDTMITEQIPIVTYDADWYEQTLTKVFADGIGKLFSSHVGPSPVIRVDKPLYRNTEGVLSIWSSMLIIILLLLILILSYISAMRYGMIEPWLQPVYEGTAQNPHLALNPIVSSATVLSRSPHSPVALRSGRPVSKKNPLITFLRWIFRGPLNADKKARAA